MFKILTIVAFYFCFWDINAQVRIGSNDEPNSNAILDLNNNFNGGLGLDSTSSPNVADAKQRLHAYTKCLHTYMSTCLHLDFQINPFSLWAESMI